MAAYGFLIERPTPVLHFLSYESFCANPYRGAARLADLLSIEDRAGFLAESGNVHPSPYRDVDLSDVDSSLLVQADAMCAQLKQLSVVDCTETA